jgi:hypothetical protein
VLVEPWKNCCACKVLIESRHVESSGHVPAWPGPGVLLGFWLNNFIIITLPNGPNRRLSRTFSPMGNLSMTGQCCLVDSSLVLRQILFWQSLEEKRSWAKSCTKRQFAWMDFESSYSQFYDFSECSDLADAKMGACLPNTGFHSCQRVPLSKKDQRINVHPAVKGIYRTLAATNVGVPPATV